MKQPTVKILVGYHKPAQLLKSDIFVPVHLGRALATQASKDGAMSEEDYQWMLDNMIGDDTGDNISYLNHYYCELTGLYWAWKNYDKLGNPDYIGFMHYRRTFLFGNKEYAPNFYGLVKRQSLDKEYLSKDITDDKHIKSIISKYDLITPKPINVTETVQAQDNYLHYKQFHDIGDYDRLINLLKTEYPNDYKDALHYSWSNEAYFLNMFIMKKDMFFDYCKWMFDILFKLKNIIPYKGRTSQENRALGFLAERLTGLFISKIIKQEHKKIKELPVSFIENTDINIGEPVPDNDVHVAVASSNEYVPYLSVILESIKSSSDNDVLYHIHVLQRNISDINKEKLRKQFADTNILLHFVTIKEDDVNVFQKECNGRHFSVDTYSRFFIPRLLPHLSKCLYLDIDMIVLDDIKKLYFTDLESHSLGVVRDWVYAGLYETAPHLRQYTHKTLGLDDPASYFQGGVQLMNLSKMRSNNTEVQLLKLAQTMKVYFVDQCISNYFYKNDVTYFPLTWNYQINDKERQDFGLLRSLPVKTLNTVLETRKSPKIVHFSGPFKPWFYPAEEYADIWWKYARQTPFYEEILAQMVNFKAGNTMSANNEIAKLRDEFTKIHFPNINNTFALQKKEIQFLFITQHLLAFRLKKIRYLLKKVFSFGKTHAKYQRKYESLKTLIKEAKRFKKRIRKI